MDITLDMNSAVYGLNLSGITGYSDRDIFFVSVCFCRGISFYTIDFTTHGDS